MGVGAATHPWAPPGWELAVLPRPRWLVHSWKAYSSVWFATPAGSCFRKVSLALSGFMFVRQAWFCCTTRGTFHRWTDGLWAAVSSISEAAAPSLKAGPGGSSSAFKQGRGVEEGSSDEEGEIEWYVTEADLGYFQQQMEGGEPASAEAWQPMCCMDLGHLQYSAWRRRMPHGRTEYKSVTIAEDSTAQEFMDFYLNDPTRARWDTMITEHGIVESGPPSQRCQVVRWLRCFPFSFISDREYILARRLWRRDGCLYAITKSIDHPAAPCRQGVVRMDSCHSMWRSRTVPDPRTPGRTACETTLLHFEDFRIPENLARFAVRHGMGSFVRKMAAAVPEFVAERRQRVDKFSEDPDAYGMHGSPASLLPARAGSSASSLDSLISEASLPAMACAPAPYACRLSSRRADRKGQRSRRGAVGAVRGLLCSAAGLAAAVMVSRSGAVDALQRPAAKQQVAQRSRRARAWSPAAVRLL